MNAVTGIVVAGGRSTRFGDCDKALAPVEGTPMLRRVADRLAPAVDELLVNCRRDQREAFAAALEGCTHTPRFAVDTIPDRGPVVGLQTGLRVASESTAIALACDLPFVDPGLLEHLLARLWTADAVAAVPHADGHPRPLAAAYETRPACEACARTLARGDGDLQSVLADLSPVVSVDEPGVREYASSRALCNVNTPADVADVLGEYQNSSDPADTADSSPTGAAGPRP